MVTKCPVCESKPELRECDGLYVVGCYTEAHMMDCGERDGFELFPLTGNKKPTKEAAYMSWEIWVDTDKCKKIADLWTENPLTTNKQKEE